MLVFYIIRSRFNNIYIYIYIHNPLCIIYEAAWFFFWQKIRIFKKISRKRLTETYVYKQTPIQMNLFFCTCSHMLIQMYVVTYVAIDAVQ